MNKRLPSGLRIVAVFPVLFFAVVNLIAIESRTAQIETAKSATVEQPQYDPLKTEKRDIQTVDLKFTDKKRQRELPLLVYLPATDQPAPVILHSHGLGGTNKTSAFLGQHWAARGYVVVFLQHPGSDDSIWKDVPLRHRMKAMLDGASLQNARLRVEDVSTVIDQLTVWNAEEKHSLRNRLNLKKIGMSGHSFGALTTQMVCGQMQLGGKPSNATRIIAAIPMSPSSPRIGDTKKAFAQVKMPWLCMTGTRDVSPIGNQNVESRLAVFTALPPGDKYELVLDEAEHSVFTERPLPGDSPPRNPNHHRAISAVTTAFWDAYLKHDLAAKSWLTTDKVRSVLEEKDRWQKK